MIVLCKKELNKKKDSPLLSASAGYTTVPSFLDGLYHSTNSSAGCTTVPTIPQCPYLSRHSNILLWGYLNGSPM